MQQALAADEAAPETAHRPQWSVLISFSPTYTNNALYRRDDRRRDVYAEPDVTLRLDGKLTSDISYRLYGRTPSTPSRKKSRETKPLPFSVRV